MTALTKAFPNAGFSPGQELRQAREKRNLKQQDVAKMIGVHQTHISAIEHDRTLPVETVHRLCELYEIDFGLLTARLVGALDEVETAIRTTPTLTPFHRELVAMVYRECRKQGPFGALASDDGEETGTS